eukprot:5199721-Amphidinium_carterae.1
MFGAIQLVTTILSRKSLTHLGIYLTTTSMDRLREPDAPIHTSRRQGRYLHPESLNAGISTMVKGKAESCAGHLSYNAPVTMQHEWSLLECAIYGTLVWHLPSDWICLHLLNLSCRQGDQHPQFPCTCRLLGLLVMGRRTGTHLQREKQRLALDLRR